MKHNFPLQPNTLDNASDEQSERLDALRVRFCDLQDYLGSKIFKSVLMFEQERIGSSLDILNAMLKRGILISLEEWIEWRELRNAFSHDYPISEQGRIDALNCTYQVAPLLLAILPRIKSYLLSHYPQVEFDG